MRRDCTAVLLGRVTLPARRSAKRIVGPNSPVKLSLKKVGADWFNLQATVAATFFRPRPGSTQSIAWQNMAPVFGLLMEGVRTQIVLKVAPVAGRLPPHAGSHRN
jgi:hypothetical protein